MEAGSHIQGSPAGSFVGGRGRVSSLELFRRGKGELKEGTSAVFSCPRLLAWGDAEAGVSHKIETPLCRVLKRPPTDL